MRLVYFVSLALSLAGCAHMTPHEKCSKPEIVSRYKDYDQCHQQLAQAEEIKQRKKVRCTTSVLGNTANTFCR